MKRFFIRQILPPVLIQLSIIAVLAYYEDKNFAPFVAPDEFGADFLSVFVLIPTVLLIAWLLAYPVALMAAVVLSWWGFLSLFR